MLTSQRTMVQKQVRRDVAHIHVVLDGLPSVQWDDQVQRGTCQEGKVEADEDKEDLVRHCDSSRLRISRWSNKREAGPVYDTIVVVFSFKMRVRASPARDGEWGTLSFCGDRARRRSAYGGEVRERKGAGGENGGGDGGDDEKEANREEQNKRTGSR